MIIDVLLDVFLMIFGIFISLIIACSILAILEILIMYPIKFVFYVTKSIYLKIFSKNVI